MAISIFTRKAFFEKQAFILLLKFHVFFLNTLDLYAVIFSAFDPTRMVVVFMGLKGDGVYKGCKSYSQILFK